MLESRGLRLVTLAMRSTYDSTSGDSSCPGTLMCSLLTKPLVLRSWGASSRSTFCAKAACACKQCQAVLMRSQGRQQRQRRAPGGCRARVQLHVLAHKG